MSAILRKVKSLPSLIRKQKSSRKLEKLCDMIPLPYEEPPSRPMNWLFLERCHLMMILVDYFIALHGMDDEENGEQGKVWYWANDIDEEYPMTYQPDNDSMVSDSLLVGLQIDYSFNIPLTNDRQMALGRYFKNYRPLQRL